MQNLDMNDVPWSGDAGSQSGLTSIVLIAFNELPYTQRCVESVRSKTDLPYEFVFVDNGSTDGTANFFASIPGAHAIRNSTNRGYPAAVNQALRIARGEQILLLNNDTVVSDHWLDKLLVALHSDSQIGLVGPSSNNAHGAQTIAVPYSDIDGIDSCAQRLSVDFCGVTEETHRLIGFCLLMRRAVLQQLGGLDERFELGCYEDDDLCRRAILAGWKAVIARDAFVHHYGQQTFTASGVDLAALLEQNKQKYLDKWNGIAFP